MLLLDNQLIDFVFENLSDKISKRIFFDFVALNLLHLFIGVQYKYENEVFNEFLSKFPYIGFKNGMVLKIYQKLAKTVTAIKTNFGQDNFYRVLFKKFDVIVADPLSLIHDFFLNQYYHSSVKVEEGDIVFDVGAFDGITSLRFSFSKPKKIFAFEFDKQSVELCKKHILYNNLNNVTLIEKPLSDSKKVVKIIKQPWGGTYIVETDNVNQKQNEIAETITIDEFVESNQIEKVDFIKMDIEGSEYKALQGAYNTLRRYKPKLAIAVYHLPNHPYLIIKFLRDLGYDQFWLSHKSFGVMDLILFAK